VTPHQPERPGEDPVRAGSALLRGWATPPLLLALFATLASSAMLWWANDTWREDNLVYLEVQGHLRQARGELLRGYLISQRLYSGGETPLDSGRCAYFEQASWRIDNALSALEPMGGRRGFGAGYQGIVQRLQDYKLLVEDMGRMACAGGTATAAPGQLLELGDKMAASETVLSSISSEIHGKFKNLSSEQVRYNKLVVLGWVGFMGLAFLVVAAQVRQRRQAEFGLRQSEERYRTLVESATIAVFVQTEGAFAYVNPACVRLLGATRPEDLLGRPVVERIPPQDRDKVRQRIRALNEGHQEQPRREQAFVRLDGAHVLVEVSAVPLVHQGHNGALVYAQDISERKRAQDMILRSLHEKEALLKEVHHRVKNNLQLVLSLMSLQEGDLETEGDLERFRRLERRVRSMALIHEQLCRSTDLGAIDLPDYIRQLLGQLADALGPGVDVAVEMSFAPAKIGINKAVPCGLLLNELVTNAYKHAFKGRDRGLLRVSLRREGDELVLAVADDGPGLPPGLDPGSGDSLGLMLIRELARQLRGSVRWLPGPGAEAEVRFSMDS